MSATRCGFVAVVGAPNAGKSTLVNALTGTKVSIVSPKIQTTRSRIIGIAIRGTSQIVLVDTPGIFVPGKRLLERAMVGAATGAIHDSDLTLLVVDASRKNALEENRAILSDLAASGKPAILALNKIDRIPRGKILLPAQEFSAAHDFTCVFMISALEHDGVEAVADYLAGAVPEGPFLYPEDEAGDMPLRLLSAEVTREKLFLQLHEEIPYSLAVETESWEEEESGAVTIRQIVWVGRESHKAIVLGKGGAKIKSVGTAARRELGEMLERPVHLFLHVKLREDWDRDPEFYRLWGLDLPQ